MTLRCTASARPFRSLLTVLLAVGLHGASRANASITGVCPDGSFFVVQHAEAIPCRNAKQVEPGDLPPLKPELLPRPHAWEVFQKRKDPNNPYNMIDAIRQAGEGTDPAVERRPAPTVAPRPSHRPATTARPPAESPALRLTDQEIRDLSRIVELSQQRAPAAFAGTRAGERGLVLRLAQSRAFEPRVWELLADRFRAAPGPVVLFSAEAKGPASFHANLTFVQDHRAFHPDPRDPTELGLIRGRLGSIATGEPVLGYVVLPARVDLSRPIDVYWNDRLITATLRPRRGVAER